MKKLLLICWLGALATNGWAQRSTIVRLQAAVQAHPQADTGRVNLLNALAFSQYATAPQQTIVAYQEALPLARKLHYASGEAVALLGIGFYHRFRNEYGPALTYTLQAQQIFRRLGDQLNEVKCLYNLSYAELGQGHFAQSMAYSLAGLRLAEAMHNQHWTTLVYSQLGNTCLQMGEYDKARHYLLRGLRLAEPVGDQSGVGHCVVYLADVCRQQGRWAEARRYYEQGLVESEKSNADTNRGITISLLQIGAMDELMGHYREAFATEFRVLRRMRRLNDVGSMPEAQITLARAYLHTGRPDSALVYGQESLRAGQRSGTKSTIRDASDVLAQASAQLGHFAEAYRYHVVFTAYKDSLSRQDLSRRTAALQYTYELDKKQSQIRLLTRNEQLSRQKNRQQQQLLFGTLAGLGVVAGLSLLLWRNNRQKQRANAQLLRQQQELKATQAQLIQKEKMASLGELTAGIAHEIQNPLNFVNNFSEVSAELVEELEEEQQRPARDAALETELLGGLKQNLVKITEHGKRAANIVRGMLEHSRASTGERAPVDINPLCDEYLRLAYQGLRAKDKTFNATLETDFAPALPLVEGVGADLGRVLLNLFSNAFYAVQKRQQAGEAGYVPHVAVSTRGVGKGVEIRVSDNGTGMPDDIKAKIFQPFFTTKPTGEGTGLGLSLSYDIVTQGHGGTLTVESEPGQGTTFTLTLPC
jgi:two-component system NtrC family sensor kinase